MIAVGAPAVDPSTPGESLLQTAALIIPTCNAARFWPAMQLSLSQQKIDPAQVLIVDSSSSDGTQQLAQDAGYRLKVITRDSFRHGATRQMAAELLTGAELLVYLTQDAIPCGERPIARLLEAFTDPEVGAAYGRQLPRPQAREIERHARLFNYPEQSAVRSFECRRQLGVRAAFFSNSFAAYRRSAFEQVGGFPRQTIVSEEVTVVARMLMEGWKAAYQGDATVIHSHPLTIAEEFSRYFDIGVHRGREAWLVEAFGSAGGEGFRFIRSEMRYLWKNKPSMLPLALVRTANKMCGYQLGKHEAYLPPAAKVFLTAQPNYWLDERQEAPGLQAHAASRSV